MAQTSLVKRWAARIVMTGSGILLALLVGEVIVRVFGLGDVYLTRGGLHCSDPDAGWKCQPDLDSRYVLPGSFDVRVRCNSRGLRDDEIPFSKPSGVRRIVVLGDSFMWGFGVENEETLSSVLEGLLPQTQCVNLGANGYSTLQEMVRLETAGLRYEPDWVVLAFTPNDLADNLDDKKGGRPKAALDGDGALRVDNRPIRRRWKSPVTQWLRHNSRLFNFVEYGTESIRLARKASNRAESLAASAAPTPSPAPDPKEGEEELDFATIELYAPPSASIEFGWEVEGLLLSRIKAMALDNNSRILVVYVAVRETSTPAQFATRVRSLAEGIDLDPDRPSRRLAEICRVLEIPFVNLEPDFRGHADPASLFLTANAHWSAAGHALAATLVARTIGDLEEE